MPAKAPFVTRRPDLGSHARAACLGTAAIAIGVGRQRFHCRSIGKLFAGKYRHQLQQAMGALVFKTCMQHQQ